MTRAPVSYFIAKSQSHFEIARFSELPRVIVAQILPFCRAGTEGGYVVIRLSTLHFPETQECDQDFVPSVERTKCFALTINRKLL